MNIQKFTQNSIQAMQDMEKYAVEYGNQELEQEHLLYALLKLDDSLILKLVEKMEINTEHFTERTEQAIRKRVKVQGGELHIGADLNKALISAEDEAKAMGDDYVSVEHLMLAMIKHPNREIKAMFTEYGFTRERFLS
ncbi:MAG: type VI secretion system ATPase TssH, partial [Lachnospiraceae bacterium]|nr:type VI secretion system ATPase TssH [Lachnospiraceae bacterium]